ncbi:MAG: hypothetical protein JSR99_13620 [Proteobacteria bacterium]|nr:hypothetical protein [Pseudomonadota bacterium]
MMRFFSLLILSAALTGNAFALEASAGADTVNTSQLGIDAKLNAINAATTAVLNKILNCAKTGQSFDSASDACIGLTKTEQQTLLSCNKYNQFYNNTTGTCASGSASKPELVRVAHFSTSNSNKTFQLGGPYQLCTLVSDSRAGDAHGYCTISGTPGTNWTIASKHYSGAAVMCTVDCYNFK